MSSVHNLEDTLRRHDSAVYNWFGGVRFDYGDVVDTNLSLPIDRNNLPLLRVIAGPERAVAEMAKRLVGLGWIAGNDPTEQAKSAAALIERARENFAVFPLPLLSIERQDPTPNPLDQGVPKVFRRQNFVQATQSWEQHQWPGAYETTYRATFWCLKRYSEVYFREWLFTQLGSNRGRQGNEALLPVIHEAPWGTINQRFVFDGSDDESSLEGEDERYFRFGYNFRLRTWHFRKPIATTSYVHDIAVRETPLVPGQSSLDDTAALPTIAPVSLNMFSFYMADNLIPTEWPRSGLATVRKVNNPERLRCTVSSVSDEVLLSNRVLPLDVDARAVVSLAFEYTSTGPSRVLIATRDPAISPAVWEADRRFDLPVKTLPTRGQCFALVKKSVLSVTVGGAGSPATVYLSNISLRHVRTLGRVNPTGSTPGGGGTVYNWTGLAQGAYLVVVSLGGVSTTSTVIVGTDSYVVNPALQVGLVALFTPTSGAVSVTVPSGLVTDAVYVMPYAGAWRGTDV